MSASKKTISDLMDVSPETVAGKEFVANLLAIEGQGAPEVASRGASVAIEFPQGGNSFAAYGIRFNRFNQPILNLAVIGNVLRWHPRWKGRLWFDEFLERVLFKTHEGTIEEWSDIHERRALVWFQSDFELHTTTASDLRDAVKLVAHENTKNEVRDWLESLQWDGVERMSQLFSRGWGTFDNEYHSGISRCWLISAVARAYEAGCKVDTLPIFEGVQGAGKGTALEALCGPKWFSEINVAIGEKDFYQSLKGKWFVEFAEMHSFSKAEVTKIKGVITTKVDRYRIPYEAHASDHPRRCVFAGTTNRDDWQIDPTGARRFWRVLCGKIDVHWIKENRAQLFAEAVAAYKAGETWWEFNTAAAAAVAADAQPAHPWEELLNNGLNKAQEYKVTDILTHVLEITKERQGDRRTEVQLRECLKRLGWECTRNRVGRFWVFNPRV